MQVAKLCQAVQIRIAGSLVALRTSSQFRRSRLNVNTDQLIDIKQSYFHNRTELSTKEWGNVTNVLLEKYKHINRHNIDAVIIGVCNDSLQLELAKSFICFLEASGRTPNDAALGKLLRIYNGIYHARGGGETALTTQEQQEILEVYDQIRSKHDVLESRLCENLIYGLVGTPKWRDGLHLMEMMKLTSSISLSAYTEMIVKAFRMQDMQLGWALLREMLEQRKQPRCEIFLEYIDVIKNDLQTLPEAFEKLLRFLETYDVVVSEKVANAFNDLAATHSSSISVVSTKLKQFGMCTACHQHLENVSLSDEDFEKLRSSFLDKVLIRNDVFQRSSPEEVERFRDYVNETGPYDCVIDGLNVAYSMGCKKPPQVFANLLANVVKYFKNKNKYVLVLGRQHMNRWPHKSMSYIKQNAAVFLANDISQDDPFLLYAAIKSGQSSDFFSRDLMRQHAFLLGPELKSIFRRWQQEHQYSLVTQTESGKILVKEPIRHLLCAHKVGSNWHVPFKKEYALHPPDSLEVPEHWLCVKLHTK